MRGGAAKGGDVIDEIRLDSTTGGGDDPAPPEATRVIVVDDHPSYAHGLATLLSALGSIDVVAIAHDADVALEITSQHQPDVVLMGIRLPERSGIEATRQIRANCPDVKVAILTASNKPSDVTEAMRAGACGYLLKQSDAGQLVAGIKAIAAGETVVESSLVSTFLDPPEGGGTLSEGEVRLVKLLSEGLELATIARLLNVSESTVKRQIVRVQRKLGAGNRIQAVVAAAKRGLL